MLTDTIILDAMGSDLSKVSDHNPITTTVHISNEEKEVNEPKIDSSEAVAVAIASSMQESQQSQQQQSQQSQSQPRDLSVPKKK